MSSNSIHSGVIPKNYIAMLEAIKEYVNILSTWIECAKVKLLEVDAEI